MVASVNGPAACPAPPNPRHRAIDNALIKCPDMVVSPFKGGIAA
jgi:hypothetical protein